MANPLAAERLDNLQTWTISLNILNTQPQRVHMEVAFQLGD
jgi:hypothetical protein